MKKEISLDKTTRLINHGPVVLVSSVLNGRVDVTPVAWHMPIDKEPPVIVLEISETHLIYECIMESGDFAVNIPPVSFVQKVVQCGSVSGRKTDKVKDFALELSPSKKIKSPSLKESLAVLECVLVKDEHLLTKYNMVVGSVQYAEAEESAFSDHWTFVSKDLRTLHHLGDKIFCVPDGTIIDLRKKK